MPGEERSRCDMPRSRRSRFSRAPMPSRLATSRLHALPHELTKYAANNASRQSAAGTVCRRTKIDGGLDPVRGWPSDPERSRSFVRPLTLRRIHMASGKFRARVRALTIVAVLALAAVMLVILVPTAVGGPSSCAVSNARTHTNYNSLQAAVDAAKARDMLEVKGRCVGSTTVARDITIKGAAGPGIPTLDGGGAGTVVHITRGTTTIAGLKITNGVANVESVEGNGCCVGGGIAVSGDRAGARLVDSLVTGNSATVFGGGIDVDDGTLTLVESTVSENTAWR